MCVFLGRAVKFFLGPSLGGDRPLAPCGSAADIMCRMLTARVCLLFIGLGLLLYYTYIYIYSTTITVGDKITMLCYRFSAFHVDPVYLEIFAGFLWSPNTGG